MKKVKSLLEDNIAPFAMKIGSIKQLVAIRDGISYMMPLIIIGSIGLILSGLPITASWYVI